MRHFTDFALIVPVISYLCFLFGPSTDTWIAVLLRMRFNTWYEGKFLKCAAGTEVTQLQKMKIELGSNFCISLFFYDMKLIKSKSRPVMTDDQLLICLQTASV